MVALSADTVGTLTIPRPRYDRSQVKVGIVHFGVGAFHRSHQAMYLDRLMNQGQALDWGICGVGVLPGRPPHAAGHGQPRLSVYVGPQALRRHLGAPRHRLDRAIPVRPGRSRTLLSKNSQTRRSAIVSLTVTEGGYNIDHATGEFDADSPAVAADLQPDAVPGTVFGLITEALARRRDRGAPRVHDHVLRQHPGQRTRSPSRYSQHSPDCVTRVGRLDQPTMSPSPTRWSTGSPRLPPTRTEPKSPTRYGIDRRVAGAVRTVRAVGSRGPTSAPADRRWKTPGSQLAARRRTVRADEIAAAQRQPSSDVLPRATSPATATSTTSPRTPNSHSSCWTTCTAKPCRRSSPPGRRPESILRQPDRPIRQPGRTRHPGAQLRQHLRPDPGVPPAGHSPSTRPRRRTESRRGDRGQLGPLQRRHRRKR